MTLPFSYWKNECSEAKIKAAHTLGQISCLTRENMNKAGTVKATLQERHCSWHLVKAPRTALTSPGLR